MAGFERLPDLLAVGVVFHARLLGLTVVQHGAVGGDPGQAAAGDVHIGKVILAGGLEPLRGKMRLHIQLIDLLI